jgi:hypothetical protein
LAAVCNCGQWLVHFQRGSPFLASEQVVVKSFPAFSQIIYLLQGVSVLVQQARRPHDTTTLHKRTSKVAEHPEEAKFEGQALCFEDGPKRFISQSKGGLFRHFYLTASVAFESQSAQRTKVCSRKLISQK